MGGLFSSLSRRFPNKHYQAVCSSDQFLYIAVYRVWRGLLCQFRVGRYNPLTKEFPMLRSENMMCPETETSYNSMHITTVKDKYMLVLMVAKDPQPTKIYTVQLVKPRRLDKIVCSGPNLDTNNLAVKFPVSIFASLHSPDIFYVLSFVTSAGMMQLYTLKIDHSTMTGTWEEVQLTNHMQCRPVVDAVMHKDTIYIFDKVAAYNQPGYTMLDALNVKKKQWDTINTGASDGHWPMQRYNQSITQHNGIIYMLGGITNAQHGRWMSTECSDQVWMLDLSTREWKMLPARLPFPGIYHIRQTSMVTVDGQLITWFLSGLIMSHGDVNTFAIMYVRPPTLKSFAMHKLIQAAPKLKTMSFKKLVHFGVPRHLAGLMQRN